MNIYTQAAQLGGGSAGDGWLPRGGGVAEHRVVAQHDGGLGPEPPGAALAEGHQHLAALRRGQTQPRRHHHQPPVGLSTVSIISSLSTLFTICTLSKLFTFSTLSIPQYLQSLLYSSIYSIFAMSTFNIISPCRPTIVGGWRNQALDTMLVLDECEEDDDLTRLHEQ